MLLLDGTQRRVRFAISVRESSKQNKRKNEFMRLIESGFKTQNEKRSVFASRSRKTKKF